MLDWPTHPDQRVKFDCLSPSESLPLAGAVLSSESVKSHPEGDGIARAFPRQEHSLKCEDERTPFGAVLFDFKRQDCKFGTLPSLLAQSKRPIMGLAGPRVTSCATT